MNQLWLILTLFIHLCVNGAVSLADWCQMCDGSMEAPASKGPLKMHMPYWPIILDTSHPVTHCNITEEWRSKLHCCKGLKTCLNQGDTFLEGLSNIIPVRIASLQVYICIQDLSNTQQ